MPSADDDSPSYDDQWQRALESFIYLNQAVQRQGLRVILLFEGPNASGKTGAIRSMYKHVNNRAARTVSLPVYSPTERTEWYLERYVKHLPSSGETVFFDRSWYNRLIVDPVNGFASEQEYQVALQDIPAFEASLMRDGLILIKLYLSITRATQRRRYDKRYADPLKAWKMNALDEDEQSRWEEYQAFTSVMFHATDIAPCQWTTIDMNERPAGRLACYQVVIAQLGAAAFQVPAAVTAAKARPMTRGTLHALAPQFVAQAGHPGVA